MINFASAGIVMRLREHPLMSHHGIPNWPPAWTWINGKFHKLTNPEVGVLENARVSVVSNTAMFITMSYDEGRYVGQFLFDDPVFCEQVCNLLRNHFGSTIQAIGDLEIP